MEDEVSNRATDEEELARRLSLEDKISATPASKGQCSDVSVNSDDGDGPVFAPPKVCPSESPLPIVGSKNLKYGCLIVIIVGSMRIHSAQEGFATPLMRMCCFAMLGWPLAVPV